MFGRLQLRGECDKMCANVTVEEPGSETAMMCIGGLSADLPVDPCSGPLLCSVNQDGTEPGPGPLESQTRPYDMFPSFSLAPPERKVPDSKQAQDGRFKLTVASAFIAPPFGTPIVSLVAGLLRRASPGPIPIAGGDLKTLATPVEFNEYVQTDYSGGAGLVQELPNYIRVKCSVQSRVFRCCANLL